MHMPRRYRLASHVGGVRKRLAAMIVTVLKDEGIEARCEPKNLWPAQGHWRQVEQDVYSWEGWCETLTPETGKWLKRSLDSWDRMSSCIKGLKITSDGFGFEVHAKNELSPAQRFKIITRERGVA